MSTQLGKSLQKFMDETDLREFIPLNDVIPLEPQAFYEKLGYLRHPRTGQEVTSLAPYQIEVWNALMQYRRVLCIKSNKIGLTTSSLMMDLQLALLPSSNALSTRGYDTLLIAQTKDIAKEHLRTLRKLIMDSPRYSKYLIDSPSEIAEMDEENSISSLKKAMRSEQTKTSVIYIRNPENEKQPSRIIALGLNNAGAILSWRNIKHLHISDATAAEGDYTEAIDNAMTRLANTSGTCLTESIPSGPDSTDKIYNMYQQYSGREPHTGDFKVIEITSDAAVKAGIITPEFLESEKIRLGPLYPRYYMAQFVAGAGNVFDDYLLNACIGEYPLAMQDGRRVLAVDPGFGSSKFGIVGVEKIGDIIYVREAKQFDRPNASKMLELVSAIYHRDGYQACYCDSSRPEFYEELRTGSEATGRKRVRADPIIFREKLGDMIMNAVAAVREVKVRIHPSFKELIYQLKAAQYDEDGKVDKKRLSFDLGDSLIMALYKARHKDVSARLLKSRLDGPRYDRVYTAKEPTAATTDIPAQNSSNPSKLVWTEGGFRYS